MRAILLVAALAFGCGESFDGGTCATGTMAGVCASGSVAMCSVPQCAEGGGYIHPRDVSCARTDDGRGQPYCTEGSEMCWSTADLTDLCPVE